MTARRLWSIAVPIWLAAAVMLAVATPASAHLKGAVWTTAADGAKVNANLYDQKCPPAIDPCVVPPLVPFLNGGPSYTSPSRWVPDGDYYFQVTDPSGKVLLSTDSIECRRFRVEQIEVEPDVWVKVTTYPVAGNPAPHIACNDEGYPWVTKTIALCPMDDTPNNGGVYKLWITRVEDYNTEDPHARFGFIPAYSKTDNFKVKGLASVWGDKVDTLGDPIEGVHIILYEVKKVKGQETLVPIDETCTAADGTFSFTELPVGKYAVDEDLDLSLCTDCGCVDHSDAIRISPEGPIYFNITKGDIGGKGKNAEPGEPIYIGQFVNYNIPVVATLEGLKFYDKNANGEWDIATEPTLAGWVITLEEKVDNGVWQQAYDMDDNLVEPQLTDVTGAYSFGNLAGDKVYRICEYKWVDLDEDGYLVYDEVLHPETDYTYNGTTYTFGGELVDAATAGWLQTAPSAGDPGPYTVQPLDAVDDVTVDVPGCCCFVVAIDPDAPEITTVSNLRFGNTLAEVCVEKLEACTDEPLAGFEFTLYYSDCETPVEYDALDNVITPIVTDETGTACWQNLLAGDYCVVETAEPGWIPVGPSDQPVSVAAGGTATVTFRNWAPSMGLTPGYWKNWRNHYTEAQFEVLLVGTIAGTIAEADAIFEHWDASPGDEMTILLAFLLANQLTLNLTQHPELPNPSEGSLVPGSSLDCSGTPIVLGDVIDDALACLADSCSREELLTIKNWLACFAESRYSTPPCL